MKSGFGFVVLYATRVRLLTVDLDYTVDQLTLSSKGKMRVEVSLSWKLRGCHRFWELPYITSYLTTWGWDILGLQSLCLIFQLLFYYYYS